MKRILVLGAGLVGTSIAIDLCREYDVTAADMNPATLRQLERHHPVRVLETDVSSPAGIKDLIRGYDLIIGALPGHLGFQTLRAVITAGKDVVDISFFDEDPFQLDELARQQQVTAIIDCGVSPGMSNIILGYHNRRMEVDRYECLVGALPVMRSRPYEYKAPFSPIDVIETYTRPARMVEHGAVVAKPALSDVEDVELDPIGTLEAFNTDGLRTLLTTMKIPHMKEKTLRYPGHADRMRLLRDTGFFDKNPVRIKGGSFRPLDLTARLLFPHWKLEEGEEEFTIMRITIEGKEAGSRKQYLYHLFDKYDRKSKTTSMARTTGYTCTAVARLVLENFFTQKGICPPECIGADEDCFGKVMDFLEERGVHYVVHERDLAG